MKTSPANTKAQKSVYIRVVLYSLLSSITAYIHSSYMIAAGLTQSQIDSIYIMLSVCGIIGVWFLAIRRRSIASFAKMIIGLVLLLCASLAAINWTIDPRLLVPAIFILLGLESPLFFIFDELLEHATTDSSTAKTRSIYLAFQNAAWIIAPLIGFILIERSTNLGIAYTAGLVLGAILLTYSIYSISHVRQEQTKTLTTNKAFNPHVLPAIYSHFILQLFYACMISIVPVYMNSELGWSWTQVGVTIALALTAFPIIQIPLGRLLDKHHIEKRIMPVALIIMGLSIIAFVSQQHSAIIAIPMLAFFFTRVGAAALEVSNESYIFRHIDYTHRTTIALFRSLSPLSYLFVPLFWLIISLSSMQSLILTTAIFILLNSIFVIGLFGFRNTLQSITK